MMKRLSCASALGIRLSDFMEGQKKILLDQKEHVRERKSRTQNKMHNSWLVKALRQDLSDLLIALLRNRPEAIRKTPTAGQMIA